LPELFLIVSIEWQHESIVCRGVGLFFGLDIVKDRKSREPNTRLANDLILKLRREDGILLSTDGPHANVIKIKPPLCFSRENVMQACSSTSQPLLPYNFPSFRRSRRLTGD
jgi:4-aminobutyrate aminotransferase-like enzyme